MDAARALELDDEDILPNLVVKQEVAQQFKLTPVPLPVDPPAKRAKKMKDEVYRGGHGRREYGQSEFSRIGQ